MGIKVTIPPIGNPESSSFVTQLNAALQTLANEFDEVVPRDGSLDMENNLDMGSNRIYNLPAPLTDAEPIRMQDIPYALKGEKGDTGPAGDVTKEISRTALKALAATSKMSRVLAEAGREGLFVFDASNLAAKVSTDPQEGVYIAPTAYPTGASGAWVRVFNGGINPQWFGAIGDGTTNDNNTVAAALSYAFANALPVDGGDKIYAISTSLTFASKTKPWIRNLRLKQLIPANDRKSLYLLNCQKIRIDNLEVDVGTSKTLGYMNGSAGLWIEGGSNHSISNVTAFGNGKNSLLVLMSTSDSYYGNLVVRDAEFDDAAATDDVMQGIFLLYNTNCVFDNFRVSNLTGNASFLGVPFTNLRTRGIALGGNNRCTFINPQVRDVDQGIDITGGDGNRNINIIGGSAYQCTSAGLKFANSAYKCKAVGFTAERCGTHGFLISGPAASGLPYKTSFIDLIGCTALDVGYNNFPSGSEFGFGVEANAFDPSYPKGVRLIGCRALDTQTVKTMQYGYYSNIVYDADKRANELIDFLSEGHTVAARWGDHRPLCHLVAGGTQSFSHGVEGPVSWTSESEDTMLMHSLSSNIDQITVPLAGVYRVKAKLTFAANSSGYRRLKITKNGVNVVYNTAAPVAGEATVVFIDERITLAANDFLKVMAEQTSGVTLSLSTGACTFEVELIRTT